MNFAKPLIEFYKSHTLIMEVSKMVIILVLMTFVALCAGNLAIRALARTGMKWKQHWNIERGYIKPRESSIY